MMRPHTAPLFAPLPRRAFGDGRLRERHFRVLSAIAFHDRFSNRRNGTGCYATNTTLSTETSVNYTTVSSVISDLVEWDYVEREKHPLNRRLNVYRVIYESSPIAKGSSPDSFYGGKVSDGSDGSTAPTNVSPNVRPEDSQHADTTGDSDRNIFRETEIKNYLRKFGKRDSAEAGRRTIPNHSGFLDVVEQELREGSPLDHISRGKIEALLEENRDDEALCERARRVLQTSVDGSTNGYRMPN